MLSGTRDGGDCPWRTCEAVSAAVQAASAAHEADPVASAALEVVLVVSEVAEAVDLSRSSVSLLGLKLRFLDCHARPPRPRQTDPARRRHEQILDLVRQAARQLAAAGHVRTA